MRTLTGWHVFGVFAFAFGTIVSVNITLAINAVRTFPGLEVENSYVASQAFEVKRAAQNALGWDVAATLDGDMLTLSFAGGDKAVAPVLESAVFGRATHVSEDQNPDFIYQNGVFTAPVIAGPGNWNLRVVAIAADGTRFQQRIVVEATK